jgi:hypothetical protein
MAFSQKTLNAFEMTRRSAACKIPVRRQGHRAFVGIYPPLPEKRIRQWRIGRFEVPSSLLAGSIYDGDLVDLQDVRPDTLDEVEDTLRSWAVATSLFDAPWKCDWPF